MKRAGNLLLFVLPFILASASTQLPQQFTPTSDRRNDQTQNGLGPSDPGVRTDAVDAGQALPGLDQTPGATEFFPTPEDSTNFTVPSNSDPAAQNAQVPTDVVQFAMFMRLLAAPTPSVSGIGGNPSP